MRGRFQFWKTFQKWAKSATQKHKMTTETELLEGPKWSNRRDCSALSRSSWPWTCRAHASASLILDQKWSMRRRRRRENQHGERLLAATSKWTKSVRIIFGSKSLTTRAREKRGTPSKYPVKRLNTFAGSAPWKSGDRDSLEQSNKIDSSDRSIPSNTGMA